MQMVTKLWDSMDSNGVHRSSYEWFGKFLFGTHGWKGVSKKYMECSIECNGVPHLLGVAANPRPDKILAEYDCAMENHLEKNRWLRIPSPSLYSVRPSVRPYVRARVQRSPESVIIPRLPNISENDPRKIQYLTTGIVKTLSLLTTKFYELS